MPREKSPDRVRLSTTLHKRAAKSLTLIARKLNMDQSRALDLIIADFERTQRETATADYVLRGMKILPDLERK